MVVSRRSSEKIPVAVIENHGNIESVCLGRVSMRPAVSLKARRMVREITEYCEGRRKKFSKSLVSLARLSVFDQKVLRAVSRVPYGRTRTYSEIAGMVRLPRAQRAVGGALGRNPFPIVIPCHRVVAKDGLGGFSAGAKWKRRLLEIEGAL